ncbi:riboflavin biosynthesis protein RibD [Synergistales bacterium]|nr:riboflavin biosynthesis protein RibD [Synergistales bacterium]
MTSKKTIDEYFMSRALSLAWRGVDGASPNPRVGCVLTKDGRVIGEGYHERRGEAHAEVNALNDAKARGEDIRDATAYVTLEPCSHFGRTPPCAPRLAESGVSRVVVGSLDPNPKVSGAGIEILRGAGLEIAMPCKEKECKWLNRGFFRSFALHRPWVTLKAAAGLDGRMALYNGVSNWITGDVARDWAHLMRAEHDGILVGAGTIRKDNPRLTTRRVCGHSPTRVVLDSHLSIAPGVAPVSYDVLGEGCIVMTTEQKHLAERRKSIEETGAEVVALPANSESDRIDLSLVMAELYAREVRSVMVEGGPKILSSFIKEELCDSLALFSAASVMGEGPGLGDGFSLETMNDVVRLRDVRVRRAGGDILTEGVFQCSPVL